MKRLLQCSIVFALPLLAGCMVHARGGYSGHRGHERHVYVEPAPVQVRVRVQTPPRPPRPPMPPKPPMPRHP